MAAPGSLGCGGGDLRVSRRRPVSSFLPPDTIDAPAAVAARIRHLPIWVFHGDADTVVPVAASREMVAALEKAGATVKYTELPGVGHIAWDPAFRDPELPAWPFAISRQP